MRILFDRNTPGRYIDAIAKRPWSTVERSEDLLSKTAPDSDIADLAERDGWVVFTRDERFFKQMKDHRNCGSLFFKMGRNDRAGEIADAVENIKNAYPDESSIACGLPGGWV